MTDEGAIAESIEGAAAWLRRERPRAAFFAWPDRQIGERGIARTFAEAALTEPGFPLREVRSADQDPPDCVAIDASGRRVALEVTELVDGEAIAHAKANRESIIWASWDCDKFDDRLRRRLHAKDQVTLIDGPYDEYMVVVYTDEPLLSPETVSGYLQAISFEQFNQIDRAYLLLSYSPALAGYPYFRLYPPRAG